MTDKSDLQKPPNNVAPRQGASDGTIETRTCVKCRLTFRLSEFPPKKGRPTELSRWCKTCLPAHLSSGPNLKPEPGSVSSLATAGDENVAPETLTPEEAFKEAIKMSQQFRTRKELFGLSDWLLECKEHGVCEVLEAFEYYLKTYPNFARSMGRPFTNFFLPGLDVKTLLEQMRQAKINTTSLANCEPHPSRSQIRGSFEWACEVTRPFRTWQENYTEDNWADTCMRYGKEETVKGLERFLTSGWAHGRPLTQFSGWFREEMSNKSKAGEDDTIPF